MNALNKTESPLQTPEPLPDLVTTGQLVLGRSATSLYREWKGPDGVEAILRRERRGFVSWRYLAEGHDGSLTSNPFDDTETIAAHCESCSPW